MLMTGDRFKQITKILRIRRVNVSKNLKSHIREDSSSNRDATVAANSSSHRVPQCKAYKPPTGFRQVSKPFTVAYQPFRDQLNDHLLSAIADQQVERLIPYVWEAKGPQAT
jgi:hypothetical protein